MQTPLFEREKPHYQIISLADIDVPHVKPNNELTKSIANVGLIHPVTLTHHDNKYNVVAGRHRLASMQQLGEDDIPAMVFEHAGFSHALAENLVRRKNPHYEFTCVRQLTQNLDDHEIALQIGCSISRIKAMSRYLNLAHILQDRLESGDLSFEAAKELLKLPIHAQEKAASENEKITKTDAQALSRRTKGAHVPLEDLPPSLFSFDITIKTQLENLINQAEEPMPEIADDLRKILRKLGE